MGGLIGVGVGLLEQFAKQAWLKVIRGEFEGKEYLVFAGTTSIGNNGKNTIVLFKDKLVGPHHCDIVLQDSCVSPVNTRIVFKDGMIYVEDMNSASGTAIGGMKIQGLNRLRSGDVLSIGEVEFCLKF